MIGTFIVKELRPKVKKIFEYGVKMEKNSETKTDILFSKFNLHSYKIFGANKLY